MPLSQADQLALIRAANAAKKQFLALKANLEDLAANPPPGDSPSQILERYQLSLFNMLKDYPFPWLLYETVTAQEAYYLKSFKKNEKLRQKAAALRAYDKDRQDVGLPPVERRKYVRQHLINQASREALAQEPKAPSSAYEFIRAPQTGGKDMFGHKIVATPPRHFPPVESAQQPGQELDFSGSIQEEDPK